MSIEIFVMKRTLQNISDAEVRFLAEVHKGERRGGVSALEANVELARRGLSVVRYRKSQLPYVEIKNG